MDVKGVLFDLDGVVVKSMEQHLEAWQFAFKECNVDILAEHFYQLEGRGVRSVVDELAKKFNIDPALKPKLIEKKIKYYNKIFKPRFYDGLVELLEFLKESEVPAAVVTGGDRGRVEKLLAKYFAGFFIGLVSADDVRNTKPFPEPYLKGAKLLNLNPEECIVIENAPLGIRAGKQAGMYVIGVETTVHGDILKEADIVVKDMQEVRRTVISLIKNNSVPANLV
jgi:HAD superfamily hydrolase (TIGR01509 family)